MRKVIFWTHLISGVITGLVIAMMSFTGVILTYERQMLAYADARSHAPIEAAGRDALPLDALLAGAAAQDPSFRPTSISWPNDASSAVILSGGRGRGMRLVDPYSGELLGEGATGLRQFFSTMTGWHRWFNASGEQRGAWRAVTAISNLAFLFLLVSGIYLWLPKVYRWPAFRMNLWFNPKVNNAKARDYNWHHVFGFWTAIPLLVIVLSATVFYFPTANNLVYQAFGESPPQRGGGGGGNAQTAQPVDAISLDVLAQRARAWSDDWERITLQLPERRGAQQGFSIDRGNGGQPQRRHTLVLDARTGELAAWEPFSDQTPGRQARLWIRFLHTGEALGIVGQTIAGFVSATTLLMVWTGFALAWRRLVSPLFRRAKAG